VSESILVTGAGGFIGSHLVEQLVERGGSVRAFVRYNSRNDHGHLEHLPEAVRAAVDVYAGDLANPEAVSAAIAGCDLVLHLGALIPIPYSYRHPREFVTANVVGTLNVLEAARRAGVRRLVQTSTSEVYGTARELPMPESHPLHPQSPYAATKVAADQLALSYHRSFELPVVIVRPFNTFGPGQSMRAVIPTIVAQALAREVIELGALDTTRDFLFVSDTVDGIVASAEVEAIEGETFNLGTGEERSIADVISEVGALLDRELNVMSVEERLRPPGSEVDRLVADARRARERLQWRPRIAFTAGLARTADWIEESLASLKPELYNL
jgi:NAD dependent epimerase/dehydratase